MTVIAAETAGEAAEAGGSAAGAKIRQRAGEEARSRGKAAATGYAAQPGQIQAPGGNKYQTAILAEFLIAAGVVAFLPLATGGNKDKDNPSPYQVNDLVQLVAIAVVYFILALLPGRAARWGAWLGLLILLGIFYKKTATGELNVALTHIHPGQGPTDQTL
jgi:hypothetical protein